MADGWSLDQFVSYWPFLLGGAVFLHFLYGLRKGADESWRAIGTFCAVLWKAPVWVLLFVKWVGSSAKCLPVVGPVVTWAGDLPKKFMNYVKATLRMNPLTLEALNMGPSPHGFEWWYAQTCDHLALLPVARGSKEFA